MDLEQVNVENPVIIKPQGLAERILGDLQPAVHVPTEQGRKMEPDGQGQVSGPQCVQELFTMGELGQGDKNLLCHLLLVASSGGREDSAPVDGGVLVVDARRDRQGQVQPAWSRQDGRGFFVRPERRWRL